MVYGCLYNTHLNPPRPLKNYKTSANTFNSSMNKATKTFRIPIALFVVQLADSLL